MPLPWGILSIISRQAHSTGIARENENRDDRGTTERSQHPRDTIFCFPTSFARSANTYNVSVTQS